MNLDQMKDIYAGLLVRVGINLQPNQPLLITAELSARDMVQRVAKAAYIAGAKIVEPAWIDSTIDHARYQHGAVENLDFVPAHEVARRRTWLDDGYARLALTGQEFPDIHNDIDPARLQRRSRAVMKATGFFMDAMMRNELQWCVAAVPTPHWARKVFPNLPEAEALEALWHTLLKMVRVDQPDPVAAWAAHDVTLSRVAEAMMKQRISALRFVDSVRGPDGLPATDLTVGLTHDPHWVRASSVSQQGVRFFPNMPTEEVFTSPHRDRTSGHVRLSKPADLYGQDVIGAWFRFENGRVTAFGADKGEAALKQLMDMPGARQLGEVALVDVKSPINQTGLLFYDGLFDENATCHIAFGKAYAEGLKGGGAMSKDQLLEFGLNDSEAHEDLMIGSASMNVDGLLLDGGSVPVMRNGAFVI